MTNINNLAQKTNFMAGSNELELSTLYLTTVNIPGMNLSIPEIGGRSGTRFNVSSDTITFNSLSIEVLIDEDFKVYKELVSKVFNNISPNSGSFANTEFDFWVQINNSKGNYLLKIEFHNCRIESISDIQLDTQDDITEHTISIDLKYDYYSVIDVESVPLLRT